MDSPSPLAPHPALLPPGTVVGAWRVQTWAGCGAYGSVYRAVHWQHEYSSPVALKLALHPGDPRFAREVKLLSQNDHPSIPRLVDQGSWQSPAGTHHPFLVRELEPVSPVRRSRPPIKTRTPRRHIWLGLSAAAVGLALAVWAGRTASHEPLEPPSVARVRRQEFLTPLRH
jgi:hypothetical protein